MKTSDNGIDFLKEVESVKLKAYLDTGGVWTNGVGHTGPDVHEGQVVDEAQVNAWLKEDVLEAEDAVNRGVKVSLSQNQFDALVSFTFNVGVSAFLNSTLLRKLNASDYEGAKNELSRWVRDNGKIVKGLVNRRLKEQKLYSA
jgi:lysozyme